MKNKLSRDLLSEYVQWEKEIHRANIAINEAIEHKKELLAEIKTREGLMRSLTTTGITTFDCILKLNDVNAMVIEINDAPMHDFDVKEEPF